MKYLSNFKLNYPYSYKYSLVPLQLLFQRGEWGNDICFKYVGVPNTNFVYPTYPDIIPPLPKPRYNPKRPQSV